MTSYRNTQTYKCSRYCLYTYFYSPFVRRSYTVRTKNVDWSELKIKVRQRKKERKFSCWRTTLTANQRWTAEWFSRPTGSFASPSLKATKQMKNDPQHRKAYDYNLYTDRWHSLRLCLQFCSLQEEARAQWQLDIALRLQGWNGTVANLPSSQSRSEIWCLKGLNVEYVLLEYVNAMLGVMLFLSSWRHFSVLKQSLSLFVLTFCAPLSEKVYCIIMLWWQSSVYGWPGCMQSIGHLSQNSCG